MIRGTKYRIVSYSVVGKVNVVEARLQDLLVHKHHMVREYHEGIEDVQMQSQSLRSPASLQMRILVAV